MNTHLPTLALAWQQSGCRSPRGKVAARMQRLTLVAKDSVKQGIEEKPLSSSASAAYGYALNQTPPWE